MQCVFSVLIHIRTIETIAKHLNDVGLHAVLPQRGSK